MTESYDQGPRSVHEPPSCAPDPQSRQLRRRPRKRRAERADPEAAREDQRLAQRCLAGEVAAWEQLYAQCHAPLVMSIREMLGGSTADANLVDEIAAKVWYTMVADDGAILARYTPERGARLITFLRAIAKDVACRHCRSERRRRRREAVVTRARVPAAFKAAEMGDSVGEFLGTLSPDERTFCDEYLLETPAEPQGNGAEDKSAKCIWRWTQRIYEKLLHFVARG